MSRNTVEKISIRYIVNARFPTERAHGYQIAQMCQAFMENGISTELWHPYRENTQELRGKLLRGLLWTSSRYTPNGVIQCRLAQLAWTLREICQFHGALYSIAYFLFRGNSKVGW